MRSSVLNKGRALAVAAVLVVVALGVLLAPAASLAMPPSPGLLLRAQTDASLRKSIDQYVSGVKPAGLDQPSATLDVASLRSSYLSVAPGSSKLSAGILDVTVGGFRQLVLLVDFSDKPAVVTPSFFDNLVFKDTVGPTSVRGYYREVSAGALQILPVAADLPSARGWLRMPHPYSYYCPVGTKGQGSYPNNCQKLAEDAMAAAKAAGTDFSNYDNNHDGIVDGVVIVHSGRGQEQSGNASDIWSHKWSVVNSVLYGSVRTREYTTEPEYWSTPGDMTVGVICHEMAHAFGLPDLYDTDYSSKGTGNWSLMSGGSWNGVNGASPSRPDAYSMTKLGFATAIQASSQSAAVTIHSANASSTGDIYRIEKTGTTGGKQYFLVENRQKSGTDSGLPGSGLLIWHVDENQASIGNTNEAHYMVDLEEAHGGTQHLSANTGSGDAGDPFPGTGNRRTFSDLTDPNSKYYDGTGDVMVTNISANSTAMSALLVRDRLNLDVTPPVTTSDARASYDTSALVSLVATDSGSGVASTNWKLDGVSGTGRTVTALTYGAHTLLYWSIDVAGNVEATSSAAFSVRDITAPVATSDAGSAYTGSAPVRVTATDEVNGSGIASISLRLDAQATLTVISPTASTTITAPGGHTLAFSALDRAGNRSATATVVFTVTAVVPVAPAAAADAKQVAGGSVRVTWSTVADATQYEFELNGTVSQPASGLNAVINGLVEGENVVRVRALNANGDAGPWSPPFTVVRVTDASAGATSTVTVSGSGSTVVLTVQVLDGASAGVAGARVALQNSGDGTTWSELTTLTTDVDGIATCPYKSATRSWVRSLVVGDEDGLGAASLAVNVLTAPGLGKPLNPASARHGRTFTICGYLKPRHASGAHSVSIKLYRYRGGKWSYYKTVKTTNANYSTYTKYSVRTSVPTSGSWRAYASYAGTADFAAMTTTYTQFKVK